MKNGILSSVSGIDYPIISSVMSIARRSLNDGPTFSCGMGDGFATAYCFCLVELGGLIMLPPVSNGGSPDIFCLALVGAASQRIPGMETLSRRKCPVVSVRISGISSGHITGSILVKTFLHISLNSVFMSCTRAAGVVGWCLSFSRSWAFTFSAASIMSISLYNVQCFSGGPHRTSRKKVHCSIMLLTAFHPMMGVTFRIWRREAMS